MKLLTIVTQGKQRLGVKTEKGVVDVHAALNIIPNIDISTTVMEAINGKVILSNSA